MADLENTLCFFCMLHLCIDDTNNNQRSISQKYIENDGKNNCFDFQIVHIRSRREHQASGKQHTITTNHSRTAVSET